MTSSTHHFPSCWDINWWWSGGDKPKSARRASGENRTVRAPAPRSDWFDRWRLFVVTPAGGRRRRGSAGIPPPDQPLRGCLLDESEAEVQLCSSTIQHLPSQWVFIFVWRSCPVSPGVMQPAETRAWMRSKASWVEPTANSSKGRRNNLLQTLEVFLRFQQISVSGKFSYQAPKRNL